MLTIPFHLGLRLSGTVFYFPYMPLWLGRGQLYRLCPSASIGNVVELTYVLWDFCVSNEL